MLSIFLFASTRESGLQELNGIHSGVQSIDMMLREIAPRVDTWLSSFTFALRKVDTHTLSRPLRVT